MRKECKTICACMALLPIAAALLACAPKTGGETETPVEIVMPEQTESRTAPVVEPTEQPTEEPTAGAQETDKARAAFAAALNNLMTNHALPDGTDCGFDENADPAGNQFAVFDVDGDGADELILAYTTTAVALQTQGIYAYDAQTNALRAELIEYPLLTIYDNGRIQADWSHNQGLAGRFWPFTLYAYDAAADAYQNIGMVDAWDKDFAAVDADGNPFPEALDENGMGLVYYLMTNGVYETVAPVSAEAYEAWRAANLGGAEVVLPPYQPLTGENIAKLAGE